MISRSHLVKLLLALLLLLTTFAVLMAFQLLIAALGDEVAARAMMAVAVGCLVGITVNLLLLLVAVTLYLTTGDRQEP